jgi:hypothetical protein
MVNFCCPKKLSDMIDALIKHVPFENENYYRFIISLQANNLTSLFPYATDLASGR